MEELRKTDEGGFTLVELLAVRRHHRDTRRHRYTELHRPAGQGEGRRRHGATAYGGDVAATPLRGSERVRRQRHRSRSLRFQAGRASGGGRGGRRQYLLYAGPWWRRHVQDHPGYGQACIRRMLGAFSAHRTRSCPLCRTWEGKWNSPATFANIRRGPTANLEGEPSALPYGYAACPMRLRNYEQGSARAEGR